MTRPKPREALVGVGRPSTYKPEYCESVVELMSQGYSFTAWCGSIPVGWETGKGWMSAYPEFSAAVKEGQTARAKLLEKGLLSDTFAGPQITARIFALKNAAPHEWRDRSTTEVTGLDGGPVETKSPDISELARVLAAIFSRGSE